MNKKTIRLTESDLHNIIKESVNNILSELDWRTYQSAADKAEELASNATFDNYEKLRRKRQAHRLQKTAIDRTNSQYGLPEDFDEKMTHGDGISFEPTQGQLKNASRRQKDLQKYFRGESSYKDGKWQ